MHSSRSKTVLSLGATIVLVLTAVVVTSAFIAGRADRQPEPTGESVSPPPLTWKKGACVKREGARFDLAPCEAADGKVTSVVGAWAPDCPADTDELVKIEPAAMSPSAASAISAASAASEASSPGRGTAVEAPHDFGAGRTACVRDLDPPHPGDPGEGGGVLRAGDCVALGGNERPCSEEGWYGRALAVVERAGQCPRRTLDAFTVGPRVVACLGEGGRVLAVGDCVTRPRGRLVSRGALDRVPCGSARAWAKVTARTGSQDRCPDGSDRYLRVRERDVPRPVTCLRRV
ncbi:hypothetical protein [Streptosporangium sp. NPDC000396]|uniref:LppU/SCO3897 family protein n=1 Tax=Streptosporangium sp. NPDC000396 TaxID=3366185 RepID=UPI0036973647